MPQVKLEITQQISDLHHLKHITAKKSSHSASASNSSFLLKRALANRVAFPSLASSSKTNKNTTNPQNLSNKTIKVPHSSNLKFNKLDSQGDKRNVSTLSTIWKNNNLKLESKVQYNKNPEKCSCIPIKLTQIRSELKSNQYRKTSNATQSSINLQNDELSGDNLIQQPNLTTANIDYDLDKIVEEIQKNMSGSCLLEQSLESLKPLDDDIKNTKEIYSAMSTSILANPAWYRDVNGRTGFVPNEWVSVPNLQCSEIKSTKLVEKKVGNFCTGWRNFFPLFVLNITFICLNYAS